MQTYKGLATEAKRKNSRVSFGKDLMDTAFRLSVTRLSKEFSSVRDRQAMADRVSSLGIQVGKYDVADDRLQCPGKESDKCWKDESRPGFVMFGRCKRVDGDSTHSFGRIDRLLASLNHPKMYISTPDNDHLPLRLRPRMVN